MNSRVCLQAVIVVALLLPAGFTRAAAVPASFITGWNVCSKQFVDAPVFRVLPLAPTAQYRAVVRQDDRSWSLSSRAPSLSLEEIWPLIRVGEFTLMLDCADREGKVLRSETSTRFKAPDFRGFKEPAADWAAAADRNIAYLINANEHLVVPYREPGVPVWIWAATPGHKNSYPDGQFSTWGRDYQTGIAFADGSDSRRNWFNGNAFACWALYKLTLYVKTLKP